MSFLDRLAGATWFVQRGRCKVGVSRQQQERVWRACVLGVKSE
jgi:hypothetical protein